MRLLGEHFIVRKWETIFAPLPLKHSSFPKPTTAGGPEKAISMLSEGSSKQNFPGVGFPLPESPAE